MQSPPSRRGRSRDANASPANLHSRLGEFFGGGSAADSGEMNHIEIEVEGTVKYSYNGETCSQKVSITTSNTKKDDFTITAKQDEKDFAGFSYTELVKGNGSTTSETVELSGTYPTGTYSEPVYYTVTLTKTVHLDKANIDVPVTMSVVTKYWDFDNNRCPGAKKDETTWKNGKYIEGSGIDIDVSGALGTAITSGKIAIEKTVSNASADTTAFCFTLYNTSDAKYLTFSNGVCNGSSETLTNDCKVEVQGGHKVVLNKVPVGTYRITELQSAGYVISSINGNTTASYTYDYTVEEKQDSSIPVVTFTNKKLNNQAGIKVKKVATGLSAGEEYPNPTISIYKTSDVEGGVPKAGAEAVWSGTLKANDSDFAYLNTTLDEGDYVVVESAASISGYECTTSLKANSSSASGMTFSVKANEICELVIANKYDRKISSINISVSKKWDDANDQDGKRPGSVSVSLLKNGEDTTETLTLSASNNWAGAFTNLTEYDSDGEAITYTVKESAVEGYTSAITGNAIDGFTITNTHTPATVDVSGTKTWDDDNDKDGKRPDSIKVNLLADGDVIDSVTVKAADNWAYSFANLPKYANGKEIVYTISEDEVEGYTSKTEGYNIINTLVPEDPEPDPQPSTDPDDGDDEGDSDDPKPLPKADSTPKTGDSAPVAPLALIACAAVALAAFALPAARRRK